MKLKEAMSRGISGKNIIGVDASSNSAAFSHFERGELKRWGKLFIAGDDTFDKCADIIGKFGGLCGAISPDLVLFEASTYVNNNAVMKQLSMIFGAAAGAARITGATVLDIPPVTWQSYIGNPPNSKKLKQEFADQNPELSDSKLKVKLRQARKQKNIDFVRMTYGVELDDDDVADAICIGHYAHSIYGG